MNWESISGHTIRYRKETGTAKAEQELSAIGLNGVQPLGEGNPMQHDSTRCAILC